MSSYAVSAYKLYVDNSINKTTLISLKFNKTIKLIRMRAPIFSLCLLLCVEMSIKYEANKCL